MTGFTAPRKKSHANSPVCTPARQLFETLFESFGPQYWWPIGGRYEPANTQARNSQQQWEIMMGAVLTQNTAWSNVEKALCNLKEAGVVCPQDVLACPETELASIIRPSGYYNQKAKKLKLLAAAAVAIQGSQNANPPLSRDQLLGIWGIGPETADSILLYAWQQPFFVIDAYTRRILHRYFPASDGRTGGLRGTPPGDLRGDRLRAKHDLPDPTATYETLQQWFQSQLPAEPQLYQEYHALIVRLATSHCRRRPDCSACPLAASCAMQYNEA
ncbi:MAG: endonuclease [Spirochaetaceae bacterium]|nr:MAG: endonuclease [Spirochaetaceae bacterium]